jgi:hypothetical protein
MQFEWGYVHKKKAQRFGGAAAPPISFRSGACPAEGKILSLHLLRPEIPKNFSKRCKIPSE